MNAVKTEKASRFFQVTIENDYGEHFPVMVDSWSRHAIDDSLASGYKATHFRAYARPEFTKWCLAMSPNGNPFLADRQWLAPYVTIHTTEPVKPGDLVRIGNYSPLSR